MKVNILYNFKKGAWGGGNQFLKALKDNLEHKNLYEDNPKYADLFLVNCDKKTFLDYYLKAYTLRKKGCPVFLRIDGPVFFRVKNKFIDSAIIHFANITNCNCIFQSYWTRNEMNNVKLCKNSNTVIYNAPNPKIFSPDKENNDSKKIKIIATSWSGNYYSKGFDIYEYLDNKLDFQKYEMTFVGNSPLKFNNIKHIKALDSINLSRELKKNDIFITASIDDSCSNSLIEAICSGLPAVVKNSGGHPELIQKGGEVFDSSDDVIEKLEKVSSQRNEYKDNLPIFKIESASNDYYHFMINNKNNKEVETYKFIFFAIQIEIYKIYTKIKGYVTKLFNYWHR
ncbi:hypothetical protein C0584_01795 [Candidatus Parcubacteria bacterium]|nr:MAG: hypothetical protein C0584_01795 [Candidatus Parcubacteria bacterium]